MATAKFDDGSIEYRGTARAFREADAAFTKIAGDHEPKHREATLYVFPFKEQSSTIICATLDVEGYQGDWHYSWHFACEGYEFESDGNEWELMTEVQGSKIQTFSTTQEAMAWLDRDVLGY